MIKVISYISFLTMLSFSLCSWGGTFFNDNDLPPVAESPAPTNSYKYFDSNATAKTQCRMSGGSWVVLNTDISLNSGHCIMDKGQDASATENSVNTTSPSSSAGFGVTCQADTDAATAECKFDNNPELKPVMSIASAIKAQLNAAAATPAALCSQMGSMAQAIDGAVAAFNGYCTTGYAKCQKSCQSDLEEAKAADKAQPGIAEEAIAEIKANTKKCIGLASNIQDVSQNIASYSQIEQLKSQTCGKVTGTELAALCAASPTLSVCQKAGAADCSNPTYAASNTVCICQKNPNDSRCGGGNNNLNNYQAKTYGSDGAGSSGTAGGDFGGMGGDFSGGISNVDPSTGKGQEAGEKSRGGSGRAGLDVGGGQNGGAGKGGAAGAAGSGASTKVIGGYGFGGGGGGGGSGSGSGAAGVPAGAYRRGAVGPDGKAVDLRQFMPGGRMDPSRGLAGVSGPDGITGPNSDIWKKINVRYFSVAHTLLP